MIKVILCTTLIPIQSPSGEPGYSPQPPLGGQGPVYLSAHRIDTVTPITDQTKAAMSLPPAAKAIVRYDDVRMGHRLYLVADDAQSVAAARRMEIRGDDSENPLGTM